MTESIEKLAFEWITTAPESVDIKSGFYCKTRDVFQARLDRMMQNLLREENVVEGDVYIFSAMAGEIGNNSFDHNMGNWPDVSGIFFAYEISEGKMKVVLADRGRGILATLKKVKPSLKNDEEALQTALRKGSLGELLKAGEMVLSL